MTSLRLSTLSSILVVALALAAPGGPERNPVSRALQAVLRSANSAWATGPGLTLEPRPSVTARLEEPVSAALVGSACPPAPSRA